VLLADIQLSMHKDPAEIKSTVVHVLPLIHQHCSFEVLVDAYVVLARLALAKSDVCICF
jgi:hypothetical protein